MHKSVKIIKDPKITSIGHSVKEFLCRLGGPSWIDITGQDTRRNRVFVTLLHGNEPSGVKAIFNWLVSPSRKKPLTNIRFFICSVEAALTEPDFSHRYLKNEPDMNRCFRPPFKGKNGILAEQILKRVQSLEPEAMIDVHNTSGSGTDFTIAPTRDDKYAAFAANFSRRFIITNISLGSLMEADVGCPIITLECGGSFDMSADQTAMNAIEIMAGRENLFDQTLRSGVSVYTNPLRFELNDSVKIGFGETPREGCDVTLAADIEKHNFGVTQADDFLGWVGPAGLDYFTAIDDQGIDIKKDLFEVREGILFTKQTLRLFMVTPRPEIATKDCLFYMVKAE